MVSLSLPLLKIPLQVLRPRPPLLLIPPPEQPNSSSFARGHGSWRRPRPDYPQGLRAGSRAPARGGLGLAGARWGWQPLLRCPPRRPQTRSARRTPPGPAPPGIPVAHREKRDAASPARASSRRAEPGTGSRRRPRGSLGLPGGTGNAGAGWGAPPPREHRAAQRPLSPLRRRPSHLPRAAAASAFMCDPETAATARDAPARRGRGGGGRNRGGRRGREPPASPGHPPARGTSAALRCLWARVCPVVRRGLGLQAAVPPRCRGRYRRWGAWGRDYISQRALRPAGNSRESWWVSRRDFISPKPSARRKWLCDVSAVACGGATAGSAAVGGSGPRRSRWRQGWT